MSEWLLEALAFASAEPVHRHAEVLHSQQLRHSSILSPCGRPNPRSTRPRVKPAVRRRCRRTWDSGDPEMESELLHRLQTEFDRAEADRCVSLLNGWVELSQGQHRLPVALFV